MCTCSLVFKMAALTQYLLHCISAKKCLVNWKIYAINPQTLTFSEFFKQEASMSKRRLATVFVGKSKEDCTSEVDHNLLVIGLQLTHFNNNG